MFDVVSGFRHVVVSLGLLVALLGSHVVAGCIVYVFGSGVLGCLKLGGFACHFCSGGLCFS